MNADDIIRVLGKERFLELKENGLQRKRDLKNTVTMMADLVPIAKLSVSADFFYLLTEIRFGQNSSAQGLAYIEAGKPEMAWINLEDLIASGATVDKGWDSEGCRVSHHWDLLRSDGVRFDEVHKRFPGSSVFSCLEDGSPRHLPSWHKLRG